MISNDNNIAGGWGKVNWEMSGLLLICFIKIENFAFSMTLYVMEERLTFMEQTLIENKNYLDEIESCREKLAEIDIRLGINQE